MVVIGNSFPTEVSKGFKGKDNVLGDFAVSLKSITTPLGMASITVENSLGVTGKLHLPKNSV